MFSLFKSKPRETYEKIEGYQKYLYCKPCKAPHHLICGPADCCRVCGSTEMKVVIGRYVYKMEKDGYYPRPDYAIETRFEVKTILNQPMKES